MANSKKIDFRSNEVVVWEKNGCGNPGIGFEKSIERNGNGQLNKYNGNGQLNKYNNAKNTNKK